MMIINPSGRKVQIPDTPEWFNKYEIELRPSGFREVTLYTESERGNPDYALIERSAGGLGDIITLLPAVEQLARKKKVSLCIPKVYEPLTRHLDIEFIPFNVRLNNGNYLLYDQYYGHIFDCFCPCGDHEAKNGFHPTRNRIENFADLLQVKPKTPVIPLKNFTSSAAKRYLSGIMKKIVGIAPFSANPSKDWPRSYLVELVQHLKQAGYYVISLHNKFETIGGEDKALTNLSLDDVAHILNRFDLLVTPDSGLMHFASALNKPVLALFGPTDGRLTMKYYGKSEFIQGKAVNGCALPCYYAGVNGYNCSRRAGDCMKTIGVHDVLEKVKDMLS